MLKFLVEGKFKHAGAINKAHIDFFEGLSRMRKKRIDEVKANEQGLYKGCIVWEYFVKGKKTLRIYGVDTI